MGLPLRQRRKCHIIFDHPCICLPAGDFLYGMVDDGGFQVMVALPAGTNGPRPEAATDMPTAGDSYCYWKADKWVLCHADSPKAAEGGYVGLIGKNLDIACD